MGDLPEFLYLNGKTVPFLEGKIHVFAPVAKYGTGVFEGIRGYRNDERETVYLFRVRDHLRRLKFSAKVLRLEIDLSEALMDELTDAMVELVRANAQRNDLHMRVSVFVEGYGERASRGPVGISIVSRERPQKDRLEAGENVCVSSWLRINDNALPPRIKCNANYQNSRLAQMEAKENGYDDAVVLNSRGKVAENTGACIFIVRDGVVITPSVTNDLLESITRATVLKLCRDVLNFETQERDVDRTELYAADEAFACGSGKEIVPIVGVDRLPVGTGKPGPLTTAIQKEYFRVVRGNDEGSTGWLTPVY